MLVEPGTVEKTEGVFVASTGAFQLWDGAVFAGRMG